MFAGRTIALIVAMTPKRAIGRRGGMPWHLPADLKHFKATTMNHAVIMGRKTFESVGKPLPGRQNIVVTRDPGWHHLGVETANDLASAVRASLTDPVFVIGGGEIYRQATDVADVLYVTEVDAEIGDADTFFPEINPREWSEQDRRCRQADDRNPYDLTFVRYSRVRTDA